MVAAETPRRLMSASAIAAAMRAPRPGASSPSTFNVARFLVGATPSDRADLRAAAPFTGVRNATPVPDFDASRRAITQSRSAPAFPNAPRTLAKPPGLSSILALQISTFVTVKLIRICSPSKPILRDTAGRASQFELAGPAGVPGGTTEKLRASSEILSRELGSVVDAARLVGEHTRPGCGQTSTTI